MFETSMGRGYRAKEVFLHAIGHLLADDEIQDVRELVAGECYFVKFDDLLRKVDDESLKYKVTQVEKIDTYTKINQESTTASKRVSNSTHKTPKETLASSQCISVEDCRVFSGFSPETVEILKSIDPNVKSEFIKFGWESMKRLGWSTKYGPTTITGDKPYIYVVPFSEAGSNQEVHRLRCVPYLTNLLRSTLL